ncbi:hypothetical protein HanIR_Chr09g0405861 [Helianthus annuus]|nr:hypothetical protein HanIR_Chr09g0405861 [Helianthus annuus]
MLFSSSFFEYLTSYMMFRILTFRWNKIKYINGTWIFFLINKRLCVFCLKELLSIFYLFI